MLIEVRKGYADAVEKHIQKVVAQRFEGAKPHELVKVQRTSGQTYDVFSFIGPTERLSEEDFRMVDGVERVTRLSFPFKTLAKYHKTPNQQEIEHPDIEVDIGGRIIKKGGFVIIAGPCAVEKKVRVGRKEISGLDYTRAVAEQIAAIARELEIYDMVILRGCPWKPRSSAYTFQGVGIEGLDVMDRAREVSGLPYICEAMSESQANAIANHADGMWVGARNSMDQELIEKVAKTGKPWGHKNGLKAMTLEEQLSWMEYGAKTGNDKCFIIERGFIDEVSGKYQRNHGDMMRALGNRDLSRVPVIIDPSHMIADPRTIPRVSCAAIQYFGFDGLMLDVGLDNAERATFQCDGQQFLYMSDFKKLAHRLVDIIKEQGKI